MTRHAYRHAAAIIIGAPAWRGTAIRNGSAFVVEQDGAHFLGTAWHVIAHWLKIRNRVKDLLFQIGDALIDPGQSLVWKDGHADMLFYRPRPSSLPIYQSLFVRLERVGHLRDRSAASMYSCLAALR